jgi:hypothetical protein
MAADGSLELWGSSGPVIWDSDASVLSYWGSEGPLNNYKQSEPAASIHMPVIARVPMQSMILGSIVVRGI